MHISFVFPSSPFYLENHLIVDIDVVENLSDHYMVEDDLGFLRGFLVKHSYAGSLGPALTSILIGERVLQPGVQVLYVRRIISSDVRKIELSYEGDKLPSGPWA